MPDTEVATEAAATVANVNAIVAAIKNPLLAAIVALLLGGGIGSFSGFTIGDSADHVTKAELKEETEDIMYVLCLLADKHEVETSECRQFK